VGLYTHPRRAGHLQHTVSRGTIANVLREHGLDVAPERLKKTTWAEFLKTQWNVLAAADFFTVHVWTGRGLARFAVLFVIELSTGRVKIAGIAAEPHSAWMSPITRNVTDVEDGCLRGKRFLIHDREPLFTVGFRETLAAAGVEAVRPPPRSPNLNARRFFRTIKESCLDRMILIGESSLRRAVSELIEHYHRERNHQELGQSVDRAVASAPNRRQPHSHSRAARWFAEYYDRRAA
jgi:putative transposase